MTKDELYDCIEIYNGSLDVCNRLSRLERKVERMAKFLSRKVAEGLTEYRLKELENKDE